MLKLEFVLTKTVKSGIALFIFKTLFFFFNKNILKIFKMKSSNIQTENIGVPNVRTFPVI